MSRGGGLGWGAAVRQAIGQPRREPMGAEPLDSNGAGRGRGQLVREASVRERSEAASLPAPLPAPLPGPPAYAAARYGPQADLLF